MILKTALVAVFLFGVACGGEDGFEPAPGATVAVEDFEGLINAAVADMGLEELDSISIEAQEFEDPRPSCFEVEVGPCSVGDPRPSPPGHAVRYLDADGREVMVTLQRSVDEQDAAELVDGQTRAMRSMETQALRKIAAPPPQGPVASGPCDAGIDPDEDKGCAWQDRDAPGVGDAARSLRSNVVPDSGYAAVAFARHDVFAMVMVRQFVSGTPGGLADEVAEGLDEQIKAALSR